MKNNIHFILLLAFCWSGSFLSSTNTVGGIKNETYSEFQTSTDNVLVGTRTGENSGQLVISKTSIQQNIVGSTSDLTGLTVTEGSISLKVNKVTSYLIFQSNNAAGEKIAVAIELVTDSNNLVYKQKSGRQIFICKSTGTCNTCEFIIDTVWIMGCRCNS